MKALFSTKQAWSRQSKLSSKVQRFIADLLTKQSLPPVPCEDKVLRADPLVTITRVDVSPDMKNAKVYFTHFDDTKHEENLVYLNAAKGNIRHQLAKELNMRFTPQLQFVVDQVAGEQQRIQDILDNLT